MRLPHSWSRPEVPPSEHDWIKLAAFIDGEGSILITERHYKTSQYPGMYLRVVIANTDPRLPLWCQEIFGGVFVKGDRVRSENHRQAYKWHVSCRQAAWVLENCLPHFLLKREQAEVSVEFQKTVIGPLGRGVTLPDEVRQKREECKAKLHELRWRQLEPSVAVQN